MTDQKNMNILILSDPNSAKSKAAVMELIPMMQIDPACMKIDVAIKDADYNNYFFDGLLNRLFVAKIPADQVTTMNMEIFNQPVNMTDMRQYNVLVCCMEEMSEKFVSFLYKNFPETKMMSYQAGRQLNNVMPTMSRQMA